VWHEELCNTCTPAQMLSNCEYGNNPYGGALCNDNLCSDRCAGLHDAAQATLVGAVVATDHSDHYGLGFVDFINPTGDSVTFTLEQCNSGRHLLEFTYGLASDDPDRPIQVTINGGSGGPGAITSFVLHFPATGGWEEWGTVRHRADLVSGTNTITMTAMQNSGPNFDSLEVLPNGDASIGHWRGNFDNSGQFYVNNQLIGGPDGTGWSTTSTFTFTEPCDETTVYAMHVVDGERDENGQHNVGGIIGSIQHCNEVVVTNQAWRCYATDMANGGTPPPADWNEPGFDDSAWERATVYGTANGHNNHWNQDEDVDGHVPADAVDDSAKWIWTMEIESHDDVYCRYVNRHEFKDCNNAAQRYLHDYPDVAQSPYAPFTHFMEHGKYEDRIWHSELCVAGCEVESTVFDWIDAQTNGQAATPDMMQGPSGTGAAAGMDDSFFEVDLPFPFPFYGQEKTRALVSVNGYLTFSGDHSHFGNTRPIPSPQAPNDMIAPYWTDLDMTETGAIYTQFFDASNLNGGNTGSCQFGIADGAACCASTCGRCGGSDCETLPGGEDSCCYHSIAGDHMSDGSSPPHTSCRATNGVGPCVNEDSFFVIEWVDIPAYGEPSQTSHFEVILYEDGAIRFQYADMSAAASTADYALPVSGIENAAGSNGRVINQCQEGTESISCDRSQNFHSNTALTIRHSCGSTPRAFSVAWCPEYNTNPFGGGGNTGASCTFDEAEDFCQRNYGGQLASITNQAEYDTLNEILPATGDATTDNEQFMIGMHSDSGGNWEYSDNTHCGQQCLNFLTSHSNGLEGLTEHNLVWTPSRPADAKLDDCCHSWNIEGFVCEMYTAPGQIAIGTRRNYEQANQFCLDYYGGTLMSIHTQDDYDKLAQLLQGYTQPVMIGLHSDAAGNWEWADGSPVDMDFLRAHSFDQLVGVDETVAVFYPPVCQDGFASPSTTCDADSADPAHFNHALHDWGQGDVPMAFACAASGNAVRNPQFTGNGDNGH